MFLFLFVILSIFFTIALPLYRIPDEGAHFIRAYEISQGHMLTSHKDGVPGRELPQNLIPIQVSNGPNIRWYNVFSASNEIVGYDMDKEFYAFPGSALYSPMSYLPQSIGIFIVKLFTNNVILIAYGGRLFNWLFVLIITYFSIKFIPIGKNIILMITLLPMNIHQSILLSPDGIINTLTVLMVAFVFNIYAKREKMNKKKLILMYLLIIGISLYKIVYVPFCLLLFIIPKESFLSKVNYYKHVIVTGILVLITSMGWLAISSRYLIEFNPGVEGGSQIKFILLHPIRYIYILIKTVLINGESYFYTLLGSHLGWLDINVNHVILLIYTALFAVVVFCDGDKIIMKINMKNILLLGSVSVLTFLLIMTSLYIQWTKVGNDIILGIQGRYFIPLLLPICIISKTILNKASSEIKSMKYIYITIFSINICVAFTAFLNCV